MGCTFTLKCVRDMIITCSHLSIAVRKISVLDLNINEEFFLIIIVKSNFYDAECFFAYSGVNTSVSFIHLLMLQDIN